MFFEAESNDVNYEINVREERTQWIVGIKKEGKDWAYHQISKQDYQYTDNTISFIHNNSSYLVDVVGQDTDYSIYTRGSYRNLKIFNDEMLLHESLKSGGSMGGGDQLTSGMPGKIVKVFVKPGDELKKGDPLLVVEAMKMENEMKALSDCKVEEVLVAAGDSIESNATLVTFE